MCLITSKNCFIKENPTLRKGLSKVEDNEHIFFSPFSPVLSQEEWDYN